MVQFLTDENGVKHYVLNVRSPDSTLFVGAGGNEGAVTGRHVAKTALQVSIAICGMAIRLPWGIQSPQELWDFLITKGDARGPVPKSRYNVTAIIPKSKTGNGSKRVWILLR